MTKAQYKKKWHSLLDPEQEAKVKAENKITDEEQKVLYDNCITMEDFADEVKQKRSGSEEEYRTKVFNFIKSQQGQDLINNAISNIDDDEYDLENDKIDRANFTYEAMGSIASYFHDSWES